MKKLGSIISKTLDRCRSLGGGQNKGCFSVYVGPQREKFVARMEWLTHPLFLALLKEAETEYGYVSEGPLKLPCDVEVFHRVLGEVSEDDVPSQGCNFALSPTYGYGRSPGTGNARETGGYRLLGVVRAVAATGK